MNPLKALLPTVIFAFLIFTNSCEKPISHDFMDTIPTQASSIAAIDLDQMLKMSGCGSKGGTITLTKDLERLLARIDNSALQSVRAVASQGHWLDLSQTYSLKLSENSQWIMTAPIKEEQEIPNTHTTILKSSLLGLAYFYPLTPQTTMVVCGKQAFFLHPDSALFRLEEMITRARASSLGNNPLLREFFQGTQQAKARFMLDFKDNPAGEDWDEARVSLTMRERTITLRAKTYNKGLQVNPLSLVLPIDPEAMDWMPNGCIVAAAAGVSAPILDKITKMVKDVPLQTHLALNALIPMLDPHGGTIAFGAAPGGNAETIKNLSLSNWQLKAILPMGEKAEPAAILIDKFIDGLYSETVDDYLAITNYNPEDYPSEYDAWPTAEFGSKILLTATIPYNSQPMKALKFKNGYEFRAAGIDSMGVATLRLLGSGDYITPAIIRDALQLIK